MGRGLEFGAALITTLAALVLISILVLAFLARSTLGRKIAFSSAGQARTEWLAQTSIETVLGDLRREILAGSKADNDPAGALYTENGVRIFVPKTHKTVVPQHVGPVVHPNLLKISMSATPNWSGSDYLASVTAPSRSLAANSTTSSSQNLRSIAPSLWNKSFLMGTSLPANWRAPDWVILTRSGAVDTNSPSGAPTMTELSNPDPSNPKRAVGRFAYALFDEGGLIDINVAGNQLNSSQNRQRGRLHQLALAELKDSGGTALIPDPATLLAWRNPVSGSNASAVPGSGGLFDPQRTFLNTIVNGAGASDQRFATRKDLIKYATDNSGVISPAALQYLTTFSRVKNAPSWTPGFDAPAGGPYNYLSNSEKKTASTINRDLANIRFSTSGVIAATANLPSRTFVAGEPLLKQKFPLSRLSWIGRTGPANGATAADVKRAFGLRFVSRGIWEYTSPDSNTRAVRIKTLNEVAALATGREPDFFELLQAGILNGSLGLSNKANQATNVFRPNADVRDIDRSKPRQIMQIGVNIIDQYDSDGWPTTILFDWFNDTSSASPTRFDPPMGYPYTPTSATYLSSLYPGVVGVEDIPYVYKIYQNYYKHPVLGGGNKVGIFQFVEMWNPHQLSGSSSGGPTKFRVRIESGVSIFTQRSDESVVASHPLDYSTSPQEIVMDTTLDSFRIPHILNNQNSTGPSAWAQPAWGPLPTGSSVWLIPGAWHDAFDNQYRFSLSFNSTRPAPTYRVDYQDESGNWSQYPYQLFPEFCYYYDDKGSGATDSTLWYGAYVRGTFRPDPRGVRWGLSDSGGNWKFNVLVGSGEGSYYGRPTYLAPAGATYDAGAMYSSGNTNDPSAVGRFNDIGNWVNGGAGLGAFAFNKVGGARSLDIDGVLRAGDNINGTSPGDIAMANLTPSNPPNPDPRPLILNRPFRTVGELGYVYRDQPWKTLDMFSATSADAALLDLFSVNDSEVYAGGVNLNTGQVPVVQAILAGSIKAEATNTVLSASEAGTLAQALITLTGGGGDGLGSLDNVSELATRYIPSITLTPGIKTQRESALRTLAEIGNVRVWNLLLDIVVQSGRYPQGSTNVNGFLVEGERHYWLHVAIDRITGTIVDRNLEPILE